jgi:hypothetical protein
VLGHFKVLLGLSRLSFIDVSVATEFSITFSLFLQIKNLFFFTTKYFCLYQVQVQSSEEQSSDIFQVDLKYTMYDIF